MPRKKMTDEQKAKRDLKKQAEHQRHLLERGMEDIKRYDIPKPAYTHEIGDRADYGAWTWTGILDKYDDGMYYKCFSVSVNHNTNKGKQVKYQIHYLPWYDLGFHRSKEEQEGIERLEEDQDVHFNYQQRDLISLVNMMLKDYGIDLEPEYQRGNVWSKQQKYDLIDSVFRNIDIGKFAVIKRPWGKNPNVPATPKLYEMLDGKQRLTALFEYYMGRFKYRGLYFYELCHRDKGHFKHYSVSYAESAPLTKEQKYRYFLKLNTTGTPVDINHIKKVRELWLKEQIKK
jgi:hypothetical protein